jgi:N utilization substance protein B
MLPNNIFEEQIEEQFNNWDDDGEMMQQLINNFLQKPTQNIQQMVSAEKWIFAKTLLTSMIDKKEYALELIKPKLRNWDSDRIALLDMLLMQMGVCELLYFETIPTKVTINEYIDLLKIIVPHKVDNL